MVVTFIGLPSGDGVAIDPIGPYDVITIAATDIIRTGDNTIASGGVIAADVAAKDGQVVGIVALGSLLDLVVLWLV